MIKPTRDIGSVLNSLSQTASSLIASTPGTVNAHIEETEKHLLDAIDDGKNVLKNLLGASSESHPAQPTAKPTTYHEAVQKTKTDIPPDTVKPKPTKAKSPKASSQKPLRASASPRLKSKSKAKTKTPTQKHYES